MAVVARLNAALEGRYRIEEEVGEGGMATDRFESARAFAAALRDPSFTAEVGRPLSSATSPGGGGARWLAGGAAVVAALAVAAAGLAWSRTSRRRSAGTAWSSPGTPSHPP